MLKYPVITALYLSPLRSLTSLINGIFLFTDEIIPPQGVCSSYHGKVCKGYLKPSARIWFNNSKVTDGGFENENIVKGLWKELIERYEEPCRGPAEVTTT